MNAKSIILVLLTLILFSSCDNSTKQVSTDRIKGNLIIFHAGSLSVPIKALADSFKVMHPELVIKPESAGSLTSIRKITDLNRSCDILASADASMIDKLMIPQFSKWNLEFAVNEMSIVYHKNSRMADQINGHNWPEILVRNDIIIGRADPNSDPCGYRTVLSLELAEKSMKIKGLASKLLAKDNRYIRPKEVDLLALLETNNVDYIFLYKSVAKQHNLPFLELGDSINLSNPGLNEWYKKVSVEVAGNNPSEKINQPGEAIVYGFTIPDNAPNKEAAIEFAKFIISGKGQEIISSFDQMPLNPARFSNESTKPEWF